MNINLTKQLINRNVIRSGTEVTAYYRGVGLSGASVVKSVGTFTVSRAAIREDDVIFEAASTVDGQTTRLSASAVILLDGMDPARMAGIYGLSGEGETLQQGKRRGRKPKVRPALEEQAETIAEIEDDLEDDEDDFEDDDIDASEDA